MSRFKKYLGKKDLLLSVAKSKVMVFEKRRGDRKGRREWSWGEEKIKEIREIKYLGYILQKNGKAGKHINEKLRRAMVAMKMTWSIEERIFKDDYLRRMKMFGALVKSIVLYGAEVLGWRYDEGIDKVKRKYVKWILDKIELYFSRGNENERVESRSNEKGSTKKRHGGQERNW